MNKITIYIGPKNGFDRLLTKEGVTNDQIVTLSMLIKESDIESREYRIRTEDSAPIEKEPLYVENLVVFSDEYSSVREHVILNFDGFINAFNIDNLYLQNPPEIIIGKIENTYSNFSLEKYSYPKLTEKRIQTIFKTFDTNIIGQENAKNCIMRSLVPLLNNKQSKPVVLLFFGSSGVGKTETAKFIAKTLGGKLFRKQLSMFQNNDFATYLFGGHHYEKSFAKDLQERETNVVLLDEFDKASTYFHSAFYQLFDEGVFEDKNYSVQIEQSVIICTSNYLSLDEVRKHLGEPIFSRFNSCIHFDNLSIDSVVKIINNTIDDELRKVDKKYLKSVNRGKIFEQLNPHLDFLKNARSIRSIVRDLISNMILNQILSEQD
ncbi:AAA family ATPase [Seleniivibrio woodruffii]|uniref:AAA family ATPase n=1 Tax=Seleniivibrio woodruffii TaxID=1078050 RepID=UPI0024096C55|nr:AAA family ATPase [Seleniivibrio woodruffii]